jgi:hypothetical protein
MAGFCAFACNLAVKATYALKPDRDAKYLRSNSFSYLAVNKSQFQMGVGGCLLSLLYQKQSQTSME